MCNLFLAMNIKGPIFEGPFYARVVKIGQFLTTVKSHYQIWENPRKFLQAAE